MAELAKRFDLTLDLILPEEAERAVGHHPASRVRNDRHRSDDHDEVKIPLGQHIGIDRGVHPAVDVLEAIDADRAEVSGYSRARFDRGTDIDVGSVAAEDDTFTVGSRTAEINNSCSGHSWPCSSIIRSPIVSVRTRPAGNSPEMIRPGRANGPRRPSLISSEGDAGRTEKFRPFSSRPLNTRSRSIVRGLVGRVII